MQGEGVLASQGRAIAHLTPVPVCLPTGTRPPILAVWSRSGGRGEALGLLSCVILGR